VPALGEPRLDGSHERMSELDHFLLTLQKTKDKISISGDNHIYKESLIGYIGL
jgi:hypothetical protein